MFNRHRRLLPGVKTAASCNLFASVTYVKNKWLHTLYLHTDTQKLLYLTLVWAEPIKRPRNSPVQFKGPGFVNKEVYVDILRRHLRDAGSRKRPKNGEPTVGSSTTTMLQHTGRFCSTIPYHRTMWQHWSIPHTLLTRLQLTFTRSIDWNQHWKDETCVMLPTYFGMRRKSWKGFHKMASRTVSSTLAAAGRSVSLHKGTILRGTKSCLIVAPFCISSK